MRRPAREQKIHYIHRLSYTAQERIVGVFVILALLFVLGLVFVKGKTTHFFEHRVQYSGYVSNAQGITSETQVRISGIEVGRVESVDITENNRIEINFYVYQRYQGLVRADSRATIGKTSLFGSTVISIAAGSPGQAIIAEGAILPIDEPGTVDDLVADLTPVIRRLADTIESVSDIVAAIDPQHVRGTAEGLSASAENLQQITGQIAGGEGALGRLVFEDEMERDMVESMQRLRSTMALLEARMNELEPVVRNAGEITESSRATAAELPALIADVREMVGQMNSAMATINVELQEVPDLVTRMKALMEEADRTVEGLQRIWPISQAVEVPSNEQVIGPQPINE